MDEINRHEFLMTINTRVFFPFSCSPLNLIPRINSQVGAGEPRAETMTKKRREKRKIKERRDRSHSARDGDKLPHLLHLALKKKKERKQRRSPFAATFPCGTRIRTFSTRGRKIKKKKRQTRAVEDSLLCINLSDYSRFMAFSYTSRIRCRLAFSRFLAASYALFPYHPLTSWTPASFHPRERKSSLDRSVFEWQMESFSL